MTTAAKNPTNQSQLLLITTPKQSTCAMKVKTNAAWVQEMFEPTLSAVMSNQAQSQWKATLDARHLPAHQRQWRSVKSEGLKCWPQLFKTWIKLSAG